MAAIIIVLLSLTFSPAFGQTNRYVYEVCDTTYKNYRIKITVIDTVNKVKITNIKTKQSMNYTLYTFRPASPVFITDTTVIVAHTCGLDVNVAHILFLNKHKHLEFENLIAINPQKPYALTSNIVVPEFYVINYFTLDTIKTFRLNTPVYKFFWKDDTVAAVDNNNRYYYFPIE